MPVPKPKQLRIAWRTEYQKYRKHNPFRSPPEEVELSRRQLANPATRRIAREGIKKMLYDARVLRRNAFLSLQPTKNGYKFYLSKKEGNVRIGKPSRDGIAVALIKFKGDGMAFAKVWIDLNKVKQDKPVADAITRTTQGKTFPRYCENILPILWQLKRQRIIPGI